MQYAATACTELPAGRGVAIRMAAVGKPEENGSAERPMRTIREEEIDLSEYRDFADAYGQLGRSLDDVYDRKRIHSAPGDLTPAESERPWLRGQKARALSIRGRPENDHVVLRGPMGRQGHDRGAAQIRAESAPARICEPADASFRGRGSGRQHALGVMASSSSRREQVAAAGFAAIGARLNSFAACDVTAVDPGAPSGRSTFPVTFRREQHRS